MPSDESITRAAEWLASARRVLVSTGAGMSRESGIPTFRDALEGLWAQYDPQELATERGFRKNPRRVWSWYAARRRRIAEAVPHAGYHALVEMEARLPSLTIVTQNIDGLHALAGSRDVVELHGSIRRAKCLDRHHPWPGPVPDDGAEESDPPPCPVCGSPLRPDVVWFGEMLPEAAVERAWRLAEECDVLLLVGTSGTVWPAAELPAVAARAGARVIEVNPEPSELNHLAAAYLQGAAGAVLPRLAAALTERRMGDG
ncbi:NAD-dependent deacylase [Longimicrobium sp.]|uniref:SIR2 family NAD-dependent protein deacylase n=1 Tax=Longimicrobium sp. TaxID=2029185 RepID=UPI002BB21305|nr:NAD-dependent deacylase [Longimicrobium sp.]HSU15918.1 NAD-dependent deacylase [Longimicrobium sp.]